MGTDTTVSEARTGGGLRAAGLAGLSGTALVGLALLLPGAPPRTDEPSQEILRFALAQRSALLVGGYLAALGIFALAWFIAGTWRMLRNGERETLLVAGVLTGVLGLALMLAGVVIVSGFALEAVRAHDLAMVRMVTDTSNVLLQVGLMGLAAFALAASLAGRTARLLSPWTVALGVGGAVVVAVTSLPALLVEHGAWQFGGSIALVGSAPLGAWVLAIAASMARGPSKRQDPQRGLARP